MPDYREVTIQLDYESKTANVWCAPRTVERQLARKGWKRLKTQAGGSWWQAPLKAISFRSPRTMQVKSPNRGNPEALAKARAKRQGQVPPASTTST